MTQHHPDLAAEQAYIDHAYDCLDQSKRAAWKLRDLSADVVRGVREVQHHGTGTEHGWYGFLTSFLPRRYGVATGKVVGRDANTDLAVVRLANGVNHFVGVWRRVGPIVQLMDPSRGRCWVRLDRFESQLYVHRMAMPAELWRAWVEGGEFVAVVRARVRALASSGSTGLS